jgi:predicted transposase/invertase (TIGR01784 family)
MELTMQAKRNLKDSLFTSLFRDPDLLRDLYSALRGINLPADIPVSINTLENALVMDLYNDISFVIGGKLVVLIEHQSTINPNMALRLLLYIAEIYERMVKGKAIYSSKPVTLPWPEFYVLYNGTEPFPDSEILRLSDLFEKPEDLGLPEGALPLLDLKVIVVNINEGMNVEFVKRCQKLSEYCTFIAKMRSFKEELGEMEKAIKETIKYCHKHDILKEYLEIHGSEVLGMLYTEWEIADALTVRFEEGFEEGREEGFEEGREEAEREGKPKWIQEGKQEGIQEGEQRIIDLLRSGKSAEELIQEYGF